jgi:hypothetical protein
VLAVGTSAARGPSVDNTRSWLEKGARFGHFTKGVIYGLIGALALQVAIGSGNRVPGEEEAVGVVGDQPFGVFLLLATAVGLFGYAIWRLIEGVQDKKNKGNGGTGLAHRIASIASGVVNGALAVAVLQLALGNGGGGGSKSWVGKLLEQPFGAVLLALIGAGIILAGLFQLYKAYTKKFLEDFRSGGLSPTERRWITRAGQVGYSARGVVLPIVGFGFVKAALDHDPGQTGGMREALVEIASSSYGPLLLGLVAVGLLAFGLFMVASARYRTIRT